jgi:glycosyltransferase involved in cell wall biosynthesis
MLVHGPYPIGEPRVQRETRAAVEAGWEVDVVATRRPGEAESATGPSGERILRLPVEHRRGLGALGVMREYLSFCFLAFVHFCASPRRYHVVQVHNPPDFLIFAPLPARLAGTRIVFDVHDLGPDMFGMRFAGRRWSAAATRALKLCERSALGLADEVVTVHEPYARELCARGAHAGHVTVVMNSVDPAVLPARSRRNGEGFRVVYHGTVTAWYGLDLVLAAAAHAKSEVPHIRLDLYGEGDALPALREQAKRLGLSCVTFHDRYLPHQEVLAAVAGAHAGVIPNRASPLNRYALSSKLLEYVELGIPAIVAALPTLEEHFSPDEVLFFRPGDVDDLARAFVEAARDPVAAGARVAAARRRAAHYAWRTNARRYIELLDRVSVRAGTPTTVSPGSTSVVTTAPAPTNAPAPMRTPPSTVAPEPRLAPRSTTVSRSSQSSSV